MTRTLFVLVALIAGLATPAAAQEAPDPPVAAAPSATGPACPRNTVAAVQAQLPGALNITCTRTPPTTVEGKVRAGKITGVHADVVVGGAIKHYELETDGVKVRVVGAIDDHSDVVGSSSKLMALFFWLFAAAAVAGALFVVTRKNLIAAVMGMVGSFLGIAAIYMMLYAQFLAVIQMLVYAGAIMVLFVFVVMILNRPEDEPVAPTGRAGQVLGGLAILYLVGRLVMILIQVQPPNPEAAAAAPPSSQLCVAWDNNHCQTYEPSEWGSISSVGTDLFGPGLFPFEAISILLLLAVVGAVAVARPMREENDAPHQVRTEGAP